MHGTMFDGLLSDIDVLTPVRELLEIRAPKGNDNHVFV